MALTGLVKDELSRVTVLKPCCRKAEVSTLLRFAGGLHLAAGRIVVEAELDTGAAARRLRKDIAEVFGHSSELIVLAPSGLRKGNRYVVRVHQGRRRPGPADRPGRRPRPAGARAAPAGRLRHHLRLRGGLARSVPRPRLADRAGPLHVARGHLPGAGGGPGHGRRGPAARRSPRRPGTSAAWTGW